MTNGSSPICFGVWFACGHIRGRETEAAQLLVPAGRSEKTLLIAPKKITFSPPRKNPALLPGSCVFKDENLLMQPIQFLKNPFTRS